MTAETHSFACGFRPGPGRPMGFTRLGRPAGFTLIELMVVLIIIAIMTAMILPEMRGTYGDAVLRSASRDLVGACSIACSRAVSFQELHRLRIDPVKGRFTIERRSGSSGKEDVFTPVRDVPGSEGTLDARLSIRIQPHTGETADTAGVGAFAEAEPGSDSGGGGEGVDFLPDGTASGGDLILRDSEGFGLALRIHPVTARVHIVPLQRE